MNQTQTSKVILFSTRKILNNVFLFSENRTTKQEQPYIAGQEYTYNLVNVNSSESIPNVEQDDAKKQLYEKIKCELESIGKDIEIDCESDDYNDYLIRIRLYIKKNNDIKDEIKNRIIKLIDSYQKNLTSSPISSEPSKIKVDIDTTNNKTILNLYKLNTSSDDYSAYAIQARKEPIPYKYEEKWINFLLDVVIQLNPNVSNIILALHDKDLKSTCNYPFHIKKNYIDVPGHSGIKYSLVIFQHVDDEMSLLNIGDYSEKGPTAEYIYKEMETFIKKDQYRLIGEKSKLLTNLYEAILRN